MLKPKYLGWLLFVGTAALAASGHEEGNGGDTVAQDFALRGRQAYQALLKMKAVPSEISLAELDRSIKYTQVISQETVSLPGPDGVPLERDAVNQPKANPPTILVNRRRWNDPRMTELAKIRLALHEYLGILGIERNNYAVSNWIEGFNPATVVELDGVYVNPEQQPEGVKIQSRGSSYLIDGSIKYRGGRYPLYRSFEAMLTPNADGTIYSGNGTIRNVFGNNGYVEAECSYEVAFRLTKSTDGSDAFYLDLWVPSTMPDSYRSDRGCVPVSNTWYYGKSLYKKKGN